MASPLASPPPVYLRSSPPLSSPPPRSSSLSSPNSPPQPSSKAIARKPLPDSHPQPKNVPASHSSVPPVRITHETPDDPVEAFSYMALSDPEPTPPAQFPPRRDSYAASASWPKDDPLNTSSSSTLARDLPTGSHNSSSSRGSLDSVPPADGYEPLHYHHRPFQLSQPALRAASDPFNGHLRPRSAYSVISDRDGRATASSPYLHARSSSRNSTASPDVRPLSFVDLLNTPYPQPGPAPAQQQQLNNAHLRSWVGNNASLLSHRQTFDMYLANVKKTDDAAVQYEFAVFMVNALRDRPPQPVSAEEIPSASLLREAKAILQRLADRSYPFAQYYLGDGYASGLFSKGREDYDRAFPLFVAASKHGHVEACYRTALCYEFGWGTRVEAARAQQFYRQAASKNHPGAMLRMAQACLAGDMGLGKRYREGIKWLKRAAESSDAQYNAAPYELGLLHESGYGDDVFADPAYAAQLFTKSADLGHVDASYRLGDAYEHGRLGCPRDPALSIHFYTGAAQGGHAGAMMALCAWYLVGAEPVLEKDENEAYEWAKRAAEMGLAKAEYAVGYFTEMGIGCRRDPLEANVWYVKAADQGDERAKHRIAAIRAAAEGHPPSAEGGKRRDGKKRFGIF
ncbi:hypothetical protein BDV59DRAFT_201856 [Aspergillus ambiguus]|uniref:putative chitin synthase activator (Chs3) n=1 Tax=Aspergillus ambiguus TaxID=176160 RepID=UPI003CCE44C1